MPKEYAHQGTKILIRILSRVKNTFSKDLFIVLMFVLLSSLVMVNHEMWRDELQAWVLARDSRTLFELQANLKYEGHQIIWYLILMPLTRLSSNPIIMQWVHLIIATASVSVLVKFSPFSWGQKLLISFGYFLIYEYAVISRNYAIGVLLIFIFCALYKHRNSKFLYIAISLSLLAHTNILGLIIAINLATALLVESLVKKIKLPIKKLLLGFTCILASILLSIIQINPAPDIDFSNHWNFIWNYAIFKATLTNFVNVFAPIPAIDLHFWNSNLVQQYSTAANLYLITIFILLCGFMLSIRRDTILLFIFLGSTFSILLFFYIKIPGSLRHHGYLYIVFLMTAWISKDSQSSDVVGVGHHFQALIMNLLFSAQVLAGSIASYFDYQLIFSNAKKVSNFITTNNYSNYQIIGNPDIIIPPVLGYLNNHRAYYPTNRSFGTYVKWSNSRREISNHEALDHVKRKFKNLEDFIFITNKPIGEDDLEINHLKLLKSFRDSVVQDENYYVYKWVK